jgi:endonuclease G
LDSEIVMGGAPQIAGTAGVERFAGAPRPVASDGDTPDVFISYARADQPVAEHLRELLETEGWDVWWDQEIYAGAQWEELLLGVLERTKVVLVLWSRNAKRSRWVKREAAAASARGKLVPCTLDDLLPPAPFDRLEAARLSGWSGAAAHPELSVLFSGLERLALPSRADSVRPGYDEGFLGQPIGLPTIPGVGDELPYLHFSVVMNPARRLPWYVAYNVEPQTHAPQRTDSWQPDPTLSRSFQPGNEQFLHTGFDRGHVVAVRTVAWGEPRHATVAMRQAFFWTNTSPQAPDLNQWSWLALEEWEREQATVHGRVVGFSGPVLRPDDPLHVVSDEQRGRLHALRTFRTPRRYWKVVVWSAPDASLEAACFVAMNGQGRDPAAAARHCTLRQIERMTGLIFPETVRNARPVRNVAAKLAERLPSMVGSGR